MIISYKPKTIAAILLAVAIMTAFSYFFFTKIDNIVNVDLYNYGLTFNNSWADKYWLNAHIFVYSAISSIILFSVSIIFFLGYNKNRKIALSSICSSLLVAGSGLSILSIYFFYKLDFIVNYDLYFYGLQLSSEWYANYSLYALLDVSLIVLSTVVGLASAVLVALSTRKSIDIIPEKLIYSTLILAGTVSLVLSIIYASSFLALIGLGMLFWGMTLTYVRTEEYVKRILLDQSASSQLAAMNRVISEADYTGNAIFLPPRYFKVPHVYKAYVPKEKNAKAPKPELMYRQKPHFFMEFLENPPALLLTPPGAELTNLFEKKLNTDFSTVKLSYLLVNLPKLLIEDLEMVKNFEMNIEENTIRVRIKGSVYREPKTDERQLDVYFSFGSPLINAIATVLARVSGKPVVMVKRRTSPSGEDVIVEYRIVDEEEYYLS